MTPLAPPSRWQPAMMSWWYHSIIDFMMANPQSTKKEMASYFKCTEVAIHLITNSDIFRAHFHARRAEFQDKLDGSIQTRLGEVAMKSLDLIYDQLDKKRDAIPLNQLVDLNDKVLTRLGYGLPKIDEARTPAPSVTVQVNAPQTLVTVPVSPSDLEAARQALRRSEAMRLVEPVRAARQNPALPEPFDGAGGTIIEGEAALEASPSGEEERRDEPLL